MKYGVTAFFFISFVFSSMIFAERDLQFDERIFDFGHVGVDFKVFHTFNMYNVSKKNYKVDSVDVSCDCTSVYHKDSLLAPYDTINFELEFETTNYYGPTTKHFTIYTDYPVLRKQDFFYKSVIGQWPAGIKPKPESIFFLSSNQEKEIIIPNPLLDKIKINNIHKYNSSFKIEVINDEALRGSALKLKVYPDNNLKTGTSYSNFTITLDIEPQKQQIILTIPVKIVMY